MSARARGMTLAEVLVAIALLAVLSLGVVGFFLSLRERRERLWRESARARDATTLVELLESACWTCVAETADGGAGVKGDRTSLSIASRSSLTGELKDLGVLAFRFDRGGARIVASMDGGVEEILASDVGYARVRYLSGRRWQGTFDSAGSEALPEAIELAVWFGPVEFGDGAAPETMLPELGEEAEVIEGTPAGLEFDASAPEPLPRRAPDVLRMIAIPDAPGAGWPGGT